MGSLLKYLLKTNAGVLEFQNFTMSRFRADDMGVFEEAGGRLLPGGYVIDSE